MNRDDQETREIVTRTARIGLKEIGMVRVTIIPGIVQTLADAKENDKAEHELVGGERHTLLVDMRLIGAMDRDARQFYTRPEAAKTIIAVALVIGSPMSRVLGNLFLGFQKPSVPSRLFTSEAEALAWLRELHG